MTYRPRTLFLCLSLLWLAANLSLAQEAKGERLTLKSRITSPQPMTGIVLWTTNAAVKTAPIQLEFTYMRYDQVVKGRGQYDWSELDKLLDQVAGRGHQLILRWHDTYVAQTNGLPKYLQQLPGYAGITAKSEGKQTGFPDWSHPEAQAFLLEFFSQYAQRYDRDPRIAFLQVGFGLWSEYHIYDGPFQLGKTFPSKELQARFANHLAGALTQTPWLISIDAAAAERSPYAEQPELLKLRFGLFDDSFNHAKHAKINEPNWRVMGMDRWQHSPTGGEFSFYTKGDQKRALAPQGANGQPFEKQAQQFHISFMLGDAQPEYQSSERIAQASMACGYQFKLLELQRSGKSTVGTITNTGIAPIYFDAYPAMRGVRAHDSLKHLLPGQSKRFTIDSVGDSRDFSIECDRLVPGQRIQFAADIE